MEKGLKYVFGPVPSRRLGRSLGVNPIPFKTCNYSCVYCQLGKAIVFTNERKMFFPPEEMADEIIEICSVKRDDIDYITFVGEGEPTLYKGLYTVSKMVKNNCNLPMAIITNGALFSTEEVRKDVLLFDVILVKVDANNEKLFRRINRPHKDIHFDKVIEGFIALRKEFSGEIWVETMLVKGLNDSEEVLWGIRDVLDRINPHKRFVTIPTRPPAEPWVEIPDSEVLFRSFRILNAVPIYDVEHGEFDLSNFSSVEEGILTLIKRHPLRLENVEDLLKQYEINVQIEDFVEKLRQKYGVKLKKYAGYTYLLHKDAKI